MSKSGGREIGVEHIQIHNIAPSAPDSGKHVGEQNPPLNLDEMEKITIRRAVETAKGNISVAARLLGISRTNSTGSSQSPQPTNAPVFNK